MLKNRITRWLRENFNDKSAGTYSHDFIALSTDAGTTRNINQDRVAMMEFFGTATELPFAIIALADGMGGMSEGGECATRSLAAFFHTTIKLRRLPAPQMLHRAALEANETVFDFVQSRGGATLSAVYISPNGPSFTVNIGDSRIYGWTRTEPKNSMPIRLTVDDNLQEAVGGHGTDLLQFCGMGPGLRPHVKEVPHHVQCLAVTSDGAHFIKSTVLDDILTCPTKPLEIARQLLAYARWRGSPDNASAAIIDIDGLRNHLTYDEPGLILANPFSLLDITGSMDESPSPEKYECAPTPAAPTATPNNRNMVETKRAKQPRTKKPKKEKDRLEDTNQFSIQIEADPANALTANEKSNDVK